MKLIQLEKNNKVARIAKVREKISNGDQEFSDVEEALEEIVEVDSAEITDVMAEEDPERNMDGNTEEDIQQ